MFYLEDIPVHKLKFKPRGKVYKEGKLDQKSTN